MASDTRHEERASGDKFAVWAGLLTVLGAVVGLVTALLGVWGPLHANPASAISTTRSGLPAKVTSHPGGSSGKGGSGGPTGATSGDGSTGQGGGFQAQIDVVRVDPSGGPVACPKTITFTARISAIQGSGTVSYRWLRSDGASAPVQTLVFDGPGSQDVTETWRRGGDPGAAISGWEGVRILSPAGATSDKANFELTCS